MSGPEGAVGVCLLCPKRHISKLMKKWCGALIRVEEVVLGSVDPDQALLFYEK